MYGRLQTIDFDHVQFAVQTCVKVHAQGLAPNNALHTLVVWDFIMVLFLTATIRMAGSIQKSTEVMHSMQSLIKLPEIRDTMMELSREMSKVMK